MTTLEEDGARTGIAAPGALNILLLAAGTGAGAGFLWLASHGDTVWVVILAALAFSYSNNTVFSLMHEAVHGHLHRNAAVNRIAGCIAAGFFPTSLSIHRAFHLTHHRNNRTDLEQFDYFRPDDNRFLKRAQWYAILTGLYWIFPVLFCLVFALVPKIIRARFLRDTESQAAVQTSAVAYAESLEGTSLWQIRLEVLASVTIQAALIWLLDLSVAGWAICYAFFAVNWSSLQYADHAWSPLDPKDGAWNLKVNPLIRALFLNYHFHLAHHRYPWVPWIHLPQFVDPGTPQPSFLRIYLRMWRGPRPIEESDRLPQIIGND